MMQIACARLIALIALLELGLAPAQPENPSFAQIAQLDQRMASTVNRLAIANAPLCDRTMPATGLVIHAVDQYSQADRAAARAYFGFPAPVAVESVIADSPAARAGIAAGSGLLEIGGKPVPGSEAKGAVTTNRDQTEAMVLALPVDAAISVKITDGDIVRTIAIEPLTACRTTSEVRYASNLLGIADGERIQIGDKFLASASDDDLAVIVAHELAHNILHHNDRLAAANAKRGLFGEFGRSQRLRKQAETDADRLSVYLLANAGFDPAIAPNFWRGPGRRIDVGIFRSRIYTSAQDRSKLMEAEIARIGAARPPYTEVGLVRDRGKPLGLAGS